MCWVHIYITQLYVFSKADVLSDIKDSYSLDLYLLTNSLWEVESGLRSKQNFCTKPSVPLSAQLRKPDVRSQAGSWHSAPVMEEVTWTVAGGSFPTLSFTLFQWSCFQFFPSYFCSLRCGCQRPQAMPVSHSKCAGALSSCCSGTSSISLLYQKMRDPISLLKCQKWWVMCHALSKIAWIWRFLLGSQANAICGAGKIWPLTVMCWVTE